MTKILLTGSLNLDSNSKLVSLEEITEPKYTYRQVCWSGPLVSTYTVIILSIMTNRPEQPVQTQIRCHRMWHLIRASTVCHSSSNILNTSTDAEQTFISYRTSMVRSSCVPIFRVNVIRAIVRQTYKNPCVKQRLRSACTSAQSDQSICWLHVPSTASRLSKEG